MFMFFNIEGIKVQKTEVPTEAFLDLKSTLSQ